MNSAIYIRVSTDAQKEQGYSLQTQLETCRVFAEENNLTVIEEITDSCSGATLDRPGLEVLRDLIDHEEVSAVIIYTDDRLSRNLAQSLVLRDEWRRKGIDLYTVTGGKSVDTAEGRLMENIHAVIGEYEREKILDRTRRNRDKKAKNGKPVMNGYPPYGYRKKGLRKDAEFVIHEPEAAIVQNIFDWYINGDGVNGPMSFRAIGIKLNKMGVEPPKHRRDSTNEWARYLISRMLKNEIYTGVTFYGKTRMVDGRRVKQPREDWIKIPVPHLAIVDRDSYDAARKRAQRNHRLAKRNRKYQYLLSGFFRCGNCGYAMGGRPRHKKGSIHLCYICSSASNRRDCSNKYRTISTRIVDNLVWEWLEWLFSNDAILYAGIRKMADRTEKELEPLRRQIQTVERLLEEKDHNVERLLSELRDGNYDDELLKNAFRRELKTASRERKALEAEHIRLETKLARVEIPPALQDEIMEIATSFRKKFPGANYEGKRFLMEKLNVEVTFYTEEENRWIRVSCGLPGSEVDIELPHSQMT